MSHCLPGTGYLRTCLLALLSVSFAGSFSAVRADIKVPKIISDHMVLQKSDKTAVWGWAAPDEDVTVTLDTQSARTKAGEDGKWKVALNLSNLGPGPFQMTIAGKNQIVISDVLVGQVWITSGQSNMEFRLKDALGAADEIAHSANPLLRQFFVQHSSGIRPLDDCNGTWTVAGPSTSGDFSAVGYFFARKVQNELKVPVAIINTSIGSTACEQWTSSEGLDADPELKPVKDLSIQSWATLLDQSKHYPESFGQWMKKYGREDKPAGNPADFAGVDIPVTGWTKVALPGALSGPGLPAAGAIWLRKEITLTADDIHSPDGRILLFFTAGFNDYDTIYWNGQQVSQALPKDRSGPLDYAFRSDGISVKFLKEGKNVLAIRFFSPVQAPQIGVYRKAAPHILSFSAAPLAGDWLAKAEYTLPSLDPAALAAIPPPPSIAYQASAPPDAPLACQVFNGMINPILPYTIAGVAWYQGESNAVRAYQYRMAFPLMIKDWRARWGLGDFPFYFCQLANLGRASTEPAENDWAELRESQSLTLKLPNTGQAVLVDIGDPGNIHPRDKRDAGERLALVALANTYHEKIPYSGPTYESNKIENDKIRISFQHTDGGLVAKPLNEVGKIYYVENPKKVPPVPTSPKSDLQGFAICGADHKWVWADAKIDGDTILVWSDQVSQPVAVRYAWDGNPTCNLYNGADLPASPFRTDDLPLLTADARYGKALPLATKAK